MGFDKSGRVFVYMVLAVSDTIIIKLDYASNMRGIDVPDTAKQYSGDFVGIVESIGPACSFRNDLKKGDFVALERHEGWIVMQGMEKYFAISERWILGKIKSERWVKRN